MRLVRRKKREGITSNNSREKEQDRLDRIAKREELKTNRVALEKPKTLGKINLNELSKTKLKKTNEQSSDSTNNNIEKTQKVSQNNGDVQIKSKENRPIENKTADEEKETLQTNYQKLSGPKTTGQKNKFRRSF